MDGTDEPEVIVLTSGQPEGKPPTPGETNDATETGDERIQRLEAELAAAQLAATDDSGSMAADATEAETGDNDSAKETDVDDSYIRGIIGASDYLMTLNGSGAVAIPPLSATQEPIVAGPIVNAFLRGAAQNAKKRGDVKTLGEWAKKNSVGVKWAAIIPPSKADGTAFVNEARYQPKGGMFWNHSDDLGTYAVPGPLELLLATVIVRFAGQRYDYGANDYEFFSTVSPMIRAKTGRKVKGRDGTLEDEWDFYPNPKSGFWTGKFGDHEMTQQDWDSLLAPLHDAGFVIKVNGDESGRIGKCPKPTETVIKAAELVATKICEGLKLAPPGSRSVSPGNGPRKVAPKHRRMLRNIKR